MPTLSYKGYEVDFDHSPDQSEIDQIIAYINTLKPKEIKPTISRSEALGKGFSNSALQFAGSFNEKVLGKGESKTPEGLTLNEDMQLKAAKDLSAAFEQHPWMTGLGAAAPMVAPMAAAAPIMPVAAAGGVGTGLAAATIPRAIVGGQQGLTSYGSRKTELMEGNPDKRFEAEQAAVPGALVDATLSAVLPAGISKAGASIPSALAQRAVTGAGMNYVAGAAGDVAQNFSASGRDLKSVDPFSLERRLPDIVSGGVTGPLLGTTLGKVSPDTRIQEAMDKIAEIEARRPGGSLIDDVTTDRIKTTEHQIKTAEDNIAKFEDVIQNIRTKDPIRAKQIETIFKQKIEQEKTRLAVALEAKQHLIGEDIVIKDAVQQSEESPTDKGITVEEIPQIESIEVTSPKESVVDVPDQLQVKPLEQQTQEQAPLYTQQEIPQERVDPETGLTEKEIDLLVQEEMAKQNAPGPKIYNAVDSTEEALVMDILKQFGLDKEDIVINLKDTTTFGRGFAGLDVNPDGSWNPNKFTIGVNPNVAGVSKSFSKAAMDKMFTGFTPEQRERFQRAWVIGHEIGHVVMYKILNTKLWDGHVAKIIADFNKWADKNRLVAEAHGALTPERRIAAKRYAYFAEYFAQRVAENMANPHKPNSVFKKYIQDMRKVWKELITKFKLPGKAFAQVDTLIRDVIAYNKELLDTTGKNLWETESVKLSAKELIAAVEPLRSPMDKNAVGFANKLPDIDSSNVIYKQQQVDDVAPIAVDGIKDLTKMLFQGGFKTLSKWAFGLQQKKALWFDQPIIQFTANTIQKAINTQIKNINDLLHGTPPDINQNGKRLWNLQRLSAENSPKKLLDKASDADVYAVLDVFHQGYGKPYQYTLSTFGRNLTSDQVKLFKSLSNMFRKMYKLAYPNKTIAQAGWYPTIRQGDYTVNLHMKNVDLVDQFNPDGSYELSNVVYSQRFFGKREAEQFIKWFDNLPLKDKGELYHEGVKEYKSDPDQTQAIHEFSRELQDFLDKNSTIFRGDLYDKIKELEDTFYSRQNTIGGHHKLRLNIPGYKGTEHFATIGQAGKSFRDAIFDSVEEYTGYIKKNEIKETLDPILNDNNLLKTHKNIVDVAQQMRDYSVNESKALLAEETKAFKRLFDYAFSVGKENAVGKLFTAKNHSLYPDMHVTDSVLGKVGRLFYIYALTLRPSFWAAQGSQFMWSGRSMVKDGQGPISAMTHMGKGIITAASQPKDFIKALHYVKDNLHTFHPQFTNDLNTFHLYSFEEGSTAKLIADLATGEKQSSAADTFSRYVSFAMMYEHYKETGLSGEELYRKAAEKTDENMVQYGKDYKAPVFRKLGPVGDMVSPLQTFAQATLGNFTADLRYMLKQPGGVAKLQASMPLMATFAISTLMAGAIGVPMIAEYELLARLYNYISKKFEWDYKLPLVTELVLAGDNDFSKRVLSHGMMSASTMAIDGEGFDIGSSLRWQPIFSGILQGDKSFTEMLPAVNWALQEAGYVSTIVKSKYDSTITEAEKKEAVLGIVPGFYKPIAEQFKYGSGEFTTDKFGHAKREKTTSEIAAKWMGTKTLPASVEEKRKNLQRLEKEQKVELKQRLLNNLVDEIQAENKEEIARIAKRLAVEFHMQPSSIKNAVMSEMYARKVPEGVRQFVGKSGNMSKQRMFEYLEYKDKFDVNPITQQEEE